MNPIILELFLAAVMVGIFWLLVVRPIQKEKKQRRAPFTERTLRSPGQSLRQKIDELDDKLDEWLLLLFAPAGIAIGCAFGESGGSGLGVRTFSLAGFAVLMCLVFSLRVRDLLRERAKYRLGFDGECQTAQHLTPLIADGCHVFHDVPFEKVDGEFFNIDHVVVGSTGIFAIETKTRSKPANSKVKSEVNYDGKQLHFPNFSESDSLNQIKASASTLSKELQRHIGKNIKVLPILTLPGWWVNRQVNGAEVAVLNSKEIRRHINSTPAVGLTEELFNQVIGYLEGKTEIAPAK